MQAIIDRIKFILTLTEAEALRVLVKMHEFFDPKWSMIFLQEEIDCLIETTAEMLHIARPAVH